MDLSANSIWPTLMHKSLQTHHAKSLVSKFFLFLCPGVTLNVQYIARWRPIRPKAIRPKAIRPKAIRPKVIRPKANRPKAIRPKAIWPKAIRPKTIILIQAPFLKKKSLEFFLGIFLWEEDTSRLFKLVNQYLFDHQLQGFNSMASDVCVILLGPCLNKPSIDVFRQMGEKRSSNLWSTLFEILVVWTLKNTIHDFNMFSNKNTAWNWPGWGTQRTQICVSYALPLGRNQHPARRGKMLFDCRPDVRLRVKWGLNENFAARCANPRAG